MRDLVAPLFLAAAGVSLASSAIAQTVAKPPVNIMGAAEIDYTPSPDRFGDWESWPGSIVMDFLLLVDQQGTITYCEPVDLAKQGELTARLCADIVQNGKVRIKPGFSLGGREGIVAFSKAPFVALRGLAGQGAEPSSPFTFQLVDMASGVFTEYEPQREYELARIEGAAPEKPEVRPNYPAYSLRAREEGSTLTILEYNADGEVVSCRPVETSGSARLDVEACIYALDNLRFKMPSTPAQQDGRYYYDLRITWDLGAFKEQAEQ